MQVTAEFVTSAASADDFPRDRLAEVAMVGRSNVGKSSLINALVRRPVARTSAEPGKTRLANFYRVQRGSAPALYLVDLPGYGYARAAGAGAGPAAGRRQAAAREFDQLVQAYFDRPGERAVFLLVDARHPGLETDLDTWEWLKTLPCPIGVIGTKVDKLNRAERVRHARALESVFAVSVPLVSAQDGEGLDELWKLIAKLPSQTRAR
jgi:GTP-binding protein